MVFRAGPFCRKGLSPQGEPCLRCGEDCGLHCVNTCTEVAGSREVLPGRQDLPNSAFSFNGEPQAQAKSDDDAWGLPLSD